MKRSIVIIAHNIRSAHNIGALLRTCDGIGVTYVFITGYSPYPHHTGDTRLPYLAQKIDRQIHKTALGAEQSIHWHYEEDVSVVINILRDKGYEIAALEQTKTSMPLHDYNTPDKIALLIGSEVEGIDTELLTAIPLHLEIPMYGKKESFNVVEATSMALYHFRFRDAYGINK